MSEVSLDDHPLLLELQSLRASVAQFQEEAHASAVKLQRHSLDVARSHERAVHLERENDTLRSELALLRANPPLNAQFSPAESQRQVQELTLSLRRLSHKLSLTEEALLAKTTELLSAQAQTAKAIANAENAYELGARVRGREEQGLSRQRNLELRAQKLEEQLKMSDGVVQEYADLVREMEAARSSTEGEKPKDLASSLQEKESSLDHLFAGFQAESGELHGKLDKITAELELCKAELDAETKVHQTLLGELGHSRTELQKLQLEDATAAKMVSRYMQFSQVSTNNLLTTLSTLQTRHSATVSTLTSQNHFLSTQLRSLESQNERLRSALDELGGEIMKETYGRRREVALRIKMGGREERVIEGLRRWVRRGDELLGRVRGSEDEDKSSAAQVDALLDMAQHARILLESIDEGMLDEQSALSLSGGKARALVIQKGLQGLLDELKEQTERRVTLEKQIAEMRDAGMLDRNANGNGYLSDEPPQVPEKTTHSDTTPLPSGLHHPPTATENGDAHPLPPEPTTEASHPSKATEEIASSATRYPPESRVSEVILIPEYATEAVPQENHGADFDQATSNAPSALSASPNTPQPPYLASASNASSIEHVLENGASDGSALSDDQKAPSALASPKPTPLVLDESEAVDALLVDSLNVESQPSQYSSVPAINDLPPVTLPVNQGQSSNAGSPKRTPLILVQSEAMETSSLDTHSVELEPLPIPSALSASPAGPQATSSQPNSSEVNNPLTNSISFPSSSTSPPASSSPSPRSSSPIPPATLPTSLIPEPGKAKEETKPPTPHPLLAELARVSKRYDELQRAFRDCHLALEGLKASLGSTTPDGYRSSASSLRSLSTPAPSWNSSAIPSDILGAALRRLDDYTEDARVELEIRIGDEALLAKGYEALLSVPGALAPTERKPLNGHGVTNREGDHDHEPTQSDVEQQIQGFVSGTDPAVCKARDAFTRKLEDVQHDIAALKRAIHDPESLEASDQSSEPVSAANPVSPNEANTHNSGGWSSWIRGPPSRSGSPAPTPQSSTFGAIMTSPRLRHSPSASSFQSLNQGQTQRPRKTSFFGFGGGSSSEPTKDPLAPLGLKVPMPSFGGVGSLGSAGLGGFGGGYGLISPTSPMAPATRSRTVSSTMYMLGLGAAGASAGQAGPGKMLRSASSASSSLGLSRQSSMMSLSSSTHSRHASEEPGSVSEEVVEMTEDEGEEGGEEDTDVE